MLSLDLYSFFILLSVVNCLLLSVLLLVSSHKRGQGNGLLAATIIFYTLPVVRIITNDTGFFRFFLDFDETGQGLIPHLAVL